MIKQTKEWLKMKKPTKYLGLPKECPYCFNPLTVYSLTLGVFPYIHADVTLKCERHFFRFCYPYEPLSPKGFQVYGCVGSRMSNIKRICPFHLDDKMIVNRYYGDLTYADGTRKIQFYCPKCYYYEREIL